MGLGKSTWDALNAITDASSASKTSEEAQEDEAWALNVLHDSLDQIDAEKGSRR